MSRSTLNPSRALLVLFSFPLGFALPVVAAADARVSESYGKLPLQFEQNQGQTDKDVRFLSRGAGYSLYLTAGEAVLVLAKPNPDAKRDARSPRARREAPADVKSIALRMSLVGAARQPRVSGLEEQPGKANYFIGKDPAKWRTNIPTYARVHYREVYPGIDLLYYGNQRQLEYDFIVAPGADPKKILLGFKGTDKLEVDAQGDLVLHAAGGVIRHQKPIIYQEIDGIRREIEGRYVRKGANRVGFKLAAYDTSRPLMIDPALSYSTYLGGSGHDFGQGIAVDAHGNAYVTGHTSSTNFPTTLGAFQIAFAGGSDAFVTKLNPDGSALVYSTYLGGSNGGNGTGGADTNEGAGIAVDADGNAYVTGFTGANDFPTTPGAFQSAFAGGWDAFVTKLNPTGSALVYSTYLGGSFLDGGSGIAVDSNGNTYVTGETQSSNFPTTVGAFQPALAGCCDAFVTKLNPTGSALVYSTYLGGRFGETSRGIVTDADGNVFVTGNTESPDFPTTMGAFQSIYGGNNDAFVTKLNPIGSGLVYSTYLGGTGGERGGGIAVDANGNAYVTGSTWSLDFPTTPGAFQPNFRGGDFDAFVAKFNPDGSLLVYSTYLGGSNGDYGNGIAVNAAGNAYVTGDTGPNIETRNCSPCTNDFPTTPGTFQPNYGGGINDAYVVKLDPTGSALAYSTYLGGSSGDSGKGIAVDTGGNAFVTGMTGICFTPSECATNNFPTTAGAFQPTAGGGTSGGGDAFVAKIVDDAPPPPTTARFEQSAASQIGSWTTYGSETGTFSGGTIVASNVAASTAMFSFTGTAVSWIGVKCNVCGIAAVSIDGGVPTTVNTAGPGAPGSLTSESVFSASGLAADASHTMVITVTGMSSSGGAHVAMDAFDVTEGSAPSSPLPSVVLPPPPVVVPPLPPVLGL